MSKQRSQVTLPKTDAADQLIAIAAQLKAGSLKVEGHDAISVADPVELKIKLDEDELEIKIEWEKA
ncbi:MAG: amphi-Trp domain-containing protein [Hyphomicrobiaceae bacterium]|nr:amphi-Trp domain-containing protein [Hyphomicrobiaceae bacterium]